MALSMPFILCIWCLLDKCRTAYSVCSALSTAVPSVGQRYCPRSRGFSRPVSAICVLPRGHVRPVFCSLRVETCSEPACLPRLLRALPISPWGVPATTGGRRLIGELGLQGQAWTRCGPDVALLGIAGKVRQTPQGFPPCAEAQCIQRAVGARAAGVHQQPSDAFPPTIKKKSHTTH